MGNELDWDSDQIISTQPQINSIPAQPLINVPLFVGACGGAECRCGDLELGRCTRHGANGIVGWGEQTAHRVRKSLEEEELLVR